MTCRTHIETCAACLRDELVAAGVLPAAKAEPPAGGQRRCTATNDSEDRCYLDAGHGVPCKFAWPDESDVGQCPHGEYGDCATCDAAEPQPSAEAEGVKCNCPGDYGQYLGEEKHNVYCPKSSRYVKPQPPTPPSGHPVEVCIAAGHAPGCQPAQPNGAGLSPIALPVKAGTAIVEGFAFPVLLDANGEELSPQDVAAALNATASSEDTALLDFAEATEDALVHVPSCSDGLPWSAVSQEIWYATLRETLRAMRAASSE